MAIVAPFVEQLPTHVAVSLTIHKKKSQGDRGGGAPFTGHHQVVLKPFVQGHRNIHTYPSSTRPDGAFWIHTYPTSTEAIILYNCRW